MDFGDVRIEYEDEKILIVDKPSGMAVHPSKMHQGDTLADWVREYLGVPEDAFTFRCITRLDKDTSGFVLIAKTLEAAQELNRLMAERKIHREYEAVVEDDGSFQESGVIDAPIARLSDDVHDIRRCVNYESGERAVTHYERLENGDGYAKVRCVLETGRTHQIRVHMAHIGHPIKGDKLYNPQSKEPTLQLRAVKLIILDTASGQVKC